MTKQTSPAFVLIGPNSTRSISRAFAAAIALETEATEVKIIMLTRGLLFRQKPWFWLHNELMQFLLWLIIFYEGLCFFWWSRFRKVRRAHRNLRNTTEQLLTTKVKTFKLREKDSSNLKIELSTAQFIVAHGIPKEIVVSFVPQGATVIHCGSLQPLEVSENYRAFSHTLNRTDVTDYEVVSYESGGSDQSQMVFGAFPTCALFSMNHKFLELYLFEACRSAVLNKGNLTVISPRKSEQSQVTYLRLLDFMVYGIATSSYFLKRMIHKLANRHGTTWHVATVGTGKNTQFNPWPAQDMDIVLLPNPKGSYLADPFPLTVRGQTYCLVEEFVYEKNRAVISAFRKDLSSWTYLGIVLEEPFHLSFPYVFSFKGETYVVPESHQSNEIRLYKVNETELKLEFQNVIMSGVSAADSLVFEYEGLWWLFTNLDETGTGDHCSLLFAYYSDDPLSNNWHPHQENPISRDARLARNGGIINSAEGMLRVGQVQKFESYGAGANLYRISKLSPLVYEESLVGPTLPLQFSAYTSHHLTRLENEYYFDIRGLI